MNDDNISCMPARNLRQKTDSFISRQPYNNVIIIKSVHWLLMVGRYVWYTEASHGLQNTTSKPRIAVPKVTVYQLSDTVNKLSYWSVCL